MIYYEWGTVDDYHGIFLVPEDADGFEFISRGELSSSCEAYRIYDTTYEINQTKLAPSILDRW